MFDIQKIKQDFKDPAKRRAMLDESKSTIESYNPFKGSDNNPADPEQADWEDIHEEGVENGKS